MSEDGLRRSASAASISSNNSTTSVQRSLHSASSLTSGSAKTVMRSSSSFQPNSLPGLRDGKSLGILASGILDKRRDGVVRAGYARRLFMLSGRALHYFRKGDEYELFGKERGQLSLKDIGYAKIIPEEETPFGAVEQGSEASYFGIFSKSHIMTFFLRVETMDLAKEWSMAINMACEVAKRKKYPSEWTNDMYDQYYAVMIG